MSSNFASTQEICEGCDGGKKRKSFGEQILVWDKFNATVWLLIVTSFVIWCVAYFAAYKPAEKASGGGHGMDHDMGHPMGSTKAPMDHHHMPMGAIY